MTRQILVVGVAGSLTAEHADYVRRELSTRFGIEAVVVPATSLAVVEVPDVVEGGPS